jgi:hypothetical protein
VTLLWAAPAQAADRVEALLLQLRQQLEQDQRQIQGLTRRVDELSKRVAQTPVIPPRGVPDPAARDVIVMQQPGNLPGRTVGPPNTAGGVGPPGAPQPVPAAPISSGADKIRVSLSGQVDRAILYGNDGKSSNFRNVDNINSSTRFRILGEGRVAPDTTLGTNLEMELRQNPSSTTTLVQNQPQAAGAVSPTIRQADVFVAKQDWGGFRLGFGSTASYLTNENDLSGTFIAHYVGAAEMDGGFAFRQRGTMLVPGGVGGKLVVSPDGAFGPAVGSVFNNFGGLGRDARIRYDTPVWEGLQFSTSYVDGGSYDAALRLGRSFEGGFRVIAAVAGADATHRDHTPTTNLGYAGVPAGFTGGASLAGINAAPILVQRRGNRAGNEYRLLGHVPGRPVTVEPYLLTLTDDSQMFTAFQHSGTAFLYVLAGKMTYRHVEDVFTLQPGDSLMFDSNGPHGPEQLLDTPLRLLLLIVCANGNH